MIFYRAVPPRKYFRHNGSAILAVVMILAVISSLIGLSSAKMTQAAMNGSTSHSSTLQASAIAATDLDLLRSIEYKDLASSAKAAVPDSPYFHEMVVSNESSYSDTIKQKTVTVKVYKGSEAIPRAEVKLTRYSVESKPSGLPIGTIIAWASAKNPTDGTWLDCNGQSCAGYAELVSILGKSTVPDYRNRFLEGSTSPNRVIEAGLPNITGELLVRNNFYSGYPHASKDSSGAFYRISGGYRSEGNADDNHNDSIYGFSASRSNAIYGKSSTVQPPATTVRWLIKAA